MMEMGAVDLEISEKLYRWLAASDDPEQLFDLLINSALDKAGAPSMAPDDQTAVLFCHGPCRNFRQHVFAHVRWIPNGQALIWSCIDCGTERRYGLLGRTHFDD